MDRSPESDPAAYERACLDAVELALADVPSRDKHVRGIRLDGAFPDTKVIVELATRTGAVTAFDWGLWGDDFGEVGEHGRASPQQVADDVMVQAYEFCFT